MTIEETVGTGKQEGSEGNASDAIPKEKYDGVLRKLGEKDNDITGLKEKVQALEAQLKSAPNSDEISRIQAELAGKTQELETVKTELGTIKEKTVSEKRASLVSKGIVEEKVKDMSESQLDALLGVIGDIKTKPLPDLGSGGGSGALQGSPMELARQAYSNKG